MASGPSRHRGAASGIRGAGDRCTARSPPTRPHVKPSGNRNPTIPPPLRRLRAEEPTRRTPHVACCRGSNHRKSPATIIMPPEARPTDTTMAGEKNVSFGIQTPSRPFARTTVPPTRERRIARTRMGSGARDGLRPSTIRRIATPLFEHMGGSETAKDDRQLLFRAGLKEVYQVRLRHYPRDLALRGYQDRVVMSQHPCRQFDRGFRVPLWERGLHHLVHADPGEVLGV